MAFKLSMMVHIYAWHIICWCLFQWPLPWCKLLSQWVGKGKKSMSNYLDKKASNITFISIKLATTVGHFYVTLTLKTFIFMAWPSCICFLYSCHIPCFIVPISHGKFRSLSLSKANCERITLPAFTLTSFIIFQSYFLSWWRLGTFFTTEKKKIEL